MALLYSYSVKKLFCKTAVGIGTQATHINTIL